MKNLTWQNPEQLFVAQELINKVKSKCCGIKDNNEYSGDFSGIPYASIRMFEGTPERPPKQVFAQYNVATKTECVGKRVLVMGKLYRRNGEWKFAAIGDAFEDRTIGQTIVRVARDYSK